MKRAAKLLLGTGLITSAGLLTSGCVAAAVGAAGAVGVAAIQDKSFGETLDDSTVSNEIKTRLLATGRGRYNEVDVEVSNGFVLLSGRVNDPLDRIEAEHIAWSARLVEDVANEIVIEGPGSFQKSANDEWITARVRSRLFTDSRIKSVNYNIETYDGRVYLLGVAQSVAELQRAAELASFVRGVQEVVSYVKVRDPVTGTVSANSASATGNSAQQAPPYYTEPSSNDELLGGPIY